MATGTNAKGKLEPRSPVVGVVLATIPLFVLLLLLQPALALALRLALVLKVATTDGGVTVFMVLAVAVVWGTSINWPLKPHKDM